MDIKKRDSNLLHKLALVPSQSQEKSRARQTWDICKISSISNATAQKLAQKLDVVINSHASMIDDRKSDGKFWLACKCPKSVSPIELNITGTLPP